MFHCIYHQQVYHPSTVQMKSCKVLSHWRLSLTEHQCKRNNGLLSHHLQNTPPLNSLDYHRVHSVLMIHCSTVEVRNKCKIQEIKKNMN